MSIGAVSLRGAKIRKTWAVLVLVAGVTICLCSSLEEQRSDG